MDAMKTRLLVAALAALALPSCIGPAIAEAEQRMMDAQRDYEIQFDEKVEEYNEGAISEDEFEEALGDLREERADEVSETWEDFEADLQAKLDTAKAIPGSVLGGPRWLDLLASVVTAVGTGTVVTNKVRDGRRKSRNEPV